MQMSFSLVEFPSTKQIQAKMVKKKINGGGVPPLSQGQSIEKNIESPNSRTHQTQH
jgi:hypothetical protein